MILVHGLKSCRRDENVLMPAGMLRRHGFGVLLIDLRDHGDSDDEDLRFAGGTEEYLDVLGAWDWLAAQGVPKDRIGILGMSFGAATTVIAGGEEPRRAGRVGGLVLRRHGRGDPRLPRPRGLSRRSWRPAASSRRGSWRATT